MLGTSIGPYVIDRALGAGGMGKVYEAHTSRETAGLAPGTTVALKLVHPHLLATEGFFKRFLREAEVGRSIDHANVVRTLDCDQLVIDGQVRCFLVMEFVRGQTLAELSAELEQVPEELCRHVAAEICTGLVAIHERGIVHRDLKPENVLITPDHGVKLMDLGVAKLADEQLRLSRTGAFVGSACYAAPEQFDGHADHRSDLHALGVLLYELVSGELPYGNDSFRAVMHRVCTVDPVPLGERAPQLSAFFEEVVGTLLAKEPSERFDTAGDLLTVLREGESSAWWRAHVRRRTVAPTQSARRLRLPRETSVHGREAELARLWAAFEAANSGDGRVVLIEGEAGIGKSRLVDELVARATAADRPFQFLFGAYAPGGAASATDGITGAFGEHLGSAGSAEWLPENALLVPAFDAALRGEPAPAGAVPLTRGSLATCFVRVTQGLGARVPVVLLVDDLHFAPAEALEHFSTLATAVPGHPVLLVGTTRRSISREWAANLQRLDHVDRLELSRLTSADVHELLRDALVSDDLARRLGGEIARRSDGNPLFAFEILRGLREAERLRLTDDGGWVATDTLDRIDVPASLRELVQARLDRLDGEDRELLDAASCWGAEFDPALVADVAGIARIPCYKRLARLEREHRLIRPSGRSFVFDHQQVQETLYDELPEALREAYHAALAEAFERATGSADREPDAVEGEVAAQLCRHFQRARLGDRSLRYLDRAVEHFVRVGRPLQALALAESVLAEPGLVEGTARAELLLSLIRSGGPIVLLGERERQEALAHEVDAIGAEAGDASLRMQAASLLSMTYWQTSRYAESETAIRRAMELAEEAGDASAQAAYTGNLGLIVASRGEQAKATVLQREFLARARELGESVMVARACLNLGNLLTSSGEVEEALALCEEARRRFTELGMRIEESRALINLGSAAHHRRRIDEAARYFRESLDMVRELGDRLGEALASGNLGSVLLERMELREAQGLYERQLALATEVGNRFHVALALKNLAAIDETCGRLESARDRIHASLEVSEAAGDALAESVARVRYAEVLAALGDLEAAHEHVRRGIDLAVKGRQPPTVQRGRYLAGVLHRLRGDEEAAREVWERLLRDADGSPDIGLAVLARCELAALEDASEEDRRAALTAVEESAEDLPTETRMQVHEALWRATGDLDQLVQAKLFLDELLERLPPEVRDAHRDNRRLPQAVLTAWREHLGDDPHYDSEAVTRVE